MLVAVMVALLWLPAIGSGGGARVSKLSIGRIHADFSDPARATTYSVLDVNESDSTAKVSYQWTLTLEAIDPNVYVNGVSVDTDCNNHGVLNGTDSTFVWHHGNKGDQLHDDGCNHDLQGKYGHQGLIAVTVTDSAGWRCDTTYKGTFSSDAALAAGLDVSSDPVCVGPGSAPPPPPPPPPPPTRPKSCKCILLTARIVPSSLDLYKPTTPQMALSFDVHWVMTCLKTKGAKGCSGTLHFPAPHGKAYETTFSEDAPNPSLTVDCKGKCGKAKDGSQGVTIDSLAGKGDLGPSQRARLGRLPIVIERVCNRKVLAPIKLWVAFDSAGNIDVAKSKLQ
jgi:hypothetical protein